MTNWIGPTTDRTQYDKDRDDQYAAEQKRLTEEAEKASDEAAVAALEAQGKAHEEAEKIVRDQREAAKKAQQEAQEKAKAQQEAQEKAELEKHAQPVLEGQHAQGQQQATRPRTSHK